MPNNVPVFNTGIAPELLSPYLNSVFESKTSNFKSDIDKLFTEERASFYVERDLRMDVLPWGQRKGQMDSVTYTAPRSLGVIESNTSTVALGIQVTMEMQRYGLYKEAKNQTEALADTMLKTKEKDAFDVLNNAFTAGSYGDAGGVLIGASHNTPVGNQSNILATASQLTESALEDLVSQMETLQDTQGKPAHLSVDRIFVAQSGKFNASKILNTELEVGTANNTINAIKYDNVIPGGYVASRYLDSDTAWFLTTDALRGFIFYNGIPLEFKEFEDGDTYNRKYSAVMNYVFNCINWQAVGGSAGA